MSTITIQLSGSTITGLTGTPTKAYTLTDTDLQSVLNWAAVAFASALPQSPTNGQILQAWIQAWINGTKTAVQQFQTPAPSVPPPIGIA